MRIRISKKLWAVLLPLALGLAPAGAVDRVIRVNPVSVARGESNQLFVVLGSLGNENAVGLSLCYDTNLLAFVKAVRTLEAINASALLNVTTNQTYRGRVGLGLALPPDTAFLAGSNAIVEVTFRALTDGPSVATTVSLCDLPIGREVVDVGAGDLGATYEDGVVNILGSCAYSLETNAVSVSGAGASGSVGVTAGNGCAWSVVNTNGWITITSGLDGSGNGTVSFSAAANPNPSPRAGLLTIADHLLTVNQPGFGCDFKISPTNRVHGAAETTNTVSVTTSNGCAWNVENTNAWIAILSGAPGQGNGTVTYSIADNPNPVVRTGWVMIAGELLTLSQPAVVCTYKLSPTNRTHGYAAATNSVSLTTSSGCAWTVVNTNDWITITSAASGLGNVSVSYTLTTNPGAAERIGSVSVADQMFTVSQAGASQGGGASVACTYKISPTNRVHGTGAASNTVTVTASNGCVWSVATTTPWITILSGASGDGSGTVSYAVEANTYPVGRTGLVSIADQLLTLSQQAVVCTYKLSPSNKVHGYSATANAVSLTTSGGCPWTVVNTNTWITITSATSGLGNVSVSYSLTTNPSATGRTGTVSVADQILTVSQAASTVPCTYKLSTTNRVHGASAATNTVSVTTSNGCTWSVANTNAWITILSGSSGDGTGTVSYAVEANPNPVGRTAWLSIGDQFLTLSQQAVVCTYKLSPTNKTHGYAAATNAVSLTTSGGCDWTVVNTNEWITITSAASGLGNVSVSYTLSANPELTGRTGTVSVADQTFTIGQAGAPCLYSLSPTNRIHGYSAATNSINLTAGGPCVWTIINTNDWIDITSPLSGTGNTTLSYKLNDNPILLQRTGVVIIADQVFALVQRAAPCLIELTPTNQVHGSGSEVGFVTVIASANCAWNVVTTNSWITILVNPAGMGSDEITYAVDANPDVVPRTAVLTIGGELFYISQQGSACSYTLAPANRVHGAGSETGQVSVTTLTGCPWSVQNTNDWIHTLSTGSGNETLSYSVDPNPSVNLRSGNLVIGGETFAVTQVGFTCAYKLSPTNRIHGNGSVTGLVSVTTSNGCAWTVLNTNSWITILSGASGDGSDSVTYAVEANPLSIERTGALLIGGQAFVLTQRGAPCTLTLSPGNRNHGYGAVTGTVNVTTIVGCGWSVENTNAWISILSGANGSGNGSFTYAVADNPGRNERTGRVYVADQILTLVQDGAPCIFSISATARTHGYAAATNSVTLTSMDGCEWTVTNTNDWVTITTATSGSGSGSVGYVVAANPYTIDRVGSVAIADKVLTLTQRAAPCVYVLTPTNRQHAYTAESGVVNVTTVSNCAWTVGNTNDWITIDSGASGTGNGTIGYSVSANPSPVARVGLLDIGDEQFRINQAGVPCDYEIAPTSRLHGSGSETGKVSVVASNTCPWTVLNTNQWITIIAGASGVGTGEVTYVTTANPTITLRQGTLSIEGHLFSLSQEAASCAYRLSPTNRPHGHGAVTGTVSVVAMSGCEWSVDNTNDWIAILDGTSGNGTGTVTYAVSANPVIVGRTGVVVIADQAFVVSQLAAPCTYSISPTKRTHGFGSTNNSISLTTLAGCSWTVINTNDWITITSDLSGSGSTTINYVVASNQITLERTGLVMIADEVFTLTQRAAPCVYELTPTNGAHGYGPETGLVAVATSATCPWTPETTNDWITLTPGAGGMGNGSVGYSVAANPNGVPREGAVFIGGLAYPVSQAGAPCTYDLSPPNRLHGAGAETGVVTVVTLEGCAWNIANVNDWITILFSTNGPGERSVTYAISGNPSTSPRSGDVTIAGRLFTVTQLGFSCTYTISPTQQLHGATAGTGTVSVTTSSGCGWPVVNTNSWVLITSGDAGTNSGSVTYTVTPNPSALPRSGTVLIAGRPLLVNQDGAVCSYAITPTNHIHGATGETGTVSVTSISDCPWSVTNTNGWVTILAGATGVGTGSVTYAVDANPTSIPRSGVLLIAGVPFTVGQAGATCVYAIAPTNANYGAGSATGLVVVTTLGGCSWDAVSAASWITISSGAHGTGSGSVGYQVAANPTIVARSGVVTIAGQSLVVTQAGADCTFLIDPTNRVHGAGLGTGLVSVTTISGCSWATTNTNSWITIESGASGVGSGSVSYTLATNPTANVRSGVLTIAGQLFTITQSGAACHFALTPSNRSHGAAVETGIVSVATLPGCGWDIANTNTWITLTTGTAGMGAGSFGYSVAANPTALGRTGSLAVADQIFTVIQTGAQCNYAIAPNSPAHAAGSATGLVVVTTIPGCGWTVDNTNTWITISGGTGNGSGSFGYAILANPQGIQRTGVVTIGSQLLTVSQAGAQCLYSLLPTSRAHGSGVESGSLDVTTIGGCSWTVDNTNSWIQITFGSAGTGSGTVGYTLLTNPSPNPRTGILRIGGNSFTVTQAGLTCLYAITPSGSTHGVGVESRTISVTTSNLCTWAVVNTNSWVSITAGASGTGTGIVSYTVLANTGPMRSGTLIVAGQPFTVTQDGMVRVIRLVNMSIQRGQTNKLLVALESQGDENALGFSVGFNTNLLTFLQAVRGKDATNASAQLNVNSNQVASAGRIGFGLALPTGAAFPAGDRTIVEISFRGAAGSTFVTTTVTNSDKPIMREVVDESAGDLTTSYTDASVSILGDCAFALGASGASFGDTGGAGSVSVTANSACAWTASNSNPWISFTSGTTGMGNGSVSFLVTANTTPSPRTGVLTIAGQSFTVNQTGITCTYAIAPTERLHSASSDTGLVAVTVASGCPWTVNNTNSWISIAPSTNGSGNGSFGYSILANPSIIPRTGMVQIAGQVFSVNQLGAPCSYGLAPTSRGHGYSGETGQVTVTALAGCSWTVVNTNPWVTITSGASGVGNGSVGYRVGINPNLTGRAGVLVIGNQSYSLSQVGNICPYSITPTSRTHGYSSDTGTVAVVSGNGCPWTTVNTNSWITINSGASGTGNGTVNYSVTFNSSGTMRTGILDINGQPFSVTQAGSPCAFAIAPSERNHGATVEPGTISLATFGGCSWAAVTTNSWITITAGASGVGSGSVSYSVAANPGGPSRTGFVMITDTDLSFKIIQAGQPCIFGLSSSNRSHGFASENGSVALTAVTGCPWTLVNSNTWITITAGAGGASSTNVAYTVAANPSGVGRTGVVVIAELSLTVTQAGAPCIITLSPTNRVHGAGGITGTVSVTTLTGCGWTVSTATPWITINSSVSNSGTGSVNYTVSDNLNAVGRTGVVSVAGQTVTLIQLGADCTYSVSPTNRSHGQGLSSGSLSVTTIPGCPWTVSNTNAWISILSATSATGSGPVDYQLSANLNAFMRTGFVLVAGQIVTFVQAATPCTYGLLPANRLHTGASETGTVSVTTINGCGWTVSNLNSWITIQSGASGTSNGVVTYVVAANPGTTLRSGVLTIEGQTFTVTQEGLPCRYQLNPAFSVLTSGNVTGLVSVTTSNGCGWVVVNTNAWIAIKSGEMGASNGLVKFTAAPNPNPSSRTGNLVIGGEIHAVTQLGSPCAYQLSSTNITRGSGMETGMVSVFTSFECSWTTVNTNSWITITSGTNGSGNATVGYTLSPNPTAGDRTGVLTIGGANATVNYVVTQFGSSCSYAVTPPNRLHGPGVETGMVFVTAVTGCTWTVTKTNTWITITSGLSGTNDGIINYSLAVNASPTQRTGVLVIGGVGGSGARSYVVTQDGIVCEYAITPTNGVHGFAASTGVVSVATSNVCPWTVSNTNSWIAIPSGTNGTGNTNVTYTLTFNPSPQSRTGSLTIAGQHYTVTQAGITCLFALTPTSRSHDYTASTGMVTVATSNLCTWTVNNTNNWITITSPPNRTNGGTFGYSVAINLATPPRIGVVDVAGQPYTITQFGIPFVAPTNRTVECGTPWNFEPPTLTGTCSNQNLNVTVLSTVTNVICGNVLNATRTWDTADGCGNRLTLTQMFRVVVTSPPLMTCGANKSVECGATWSFNPPTATDGCGGGNVSIRVVSTVTNRVGACGNTFVALRTWEAADVCSNKATCLQIVSVVDTTPPVIVCASNRVVECGTAWNFTAPAASDGCSTNVTVQILSTVTNTLGSCGSTYSATRTWEAMDSCTNRATCSQTVTVVDTTAPTLTCSADKVVDCALGWNFDAPSATDNCAGATVNIVIVSTVTNTVGFCNGTYSATRTWEATDGCSNKSTCAQTVRLVDTTGPVMVCQANKVVEYGLNWNFDLPTVTESCSSGSVTIRVVATVTNTVGFCGSTFSATRFWEASDGCSNRSALCSQTVRTVDTTPPVLTCAANKGVRCNLPWSFDTPTASDLSSGTNVVITIVSTVTNGTCGNGLTVTRIWQAVDSCTNRATCSQTVSGVNQVLLGGTVSAAGASGRLGTVSMVVTGDTNLVTQTDSSGVYGFTLNVGASGTLSPTLTNSNPVANGVTTLDISLIRRHILNIAPLDSPYKLLAADVNGSRTVSSLDLTFIRKMILSPTNPLPSGLWRFVPSNYSFPNEQSPWDAPTSRTFADLSADLNGQDFLAIKMGDVNSSWTPPVVPPDFTPAAIKAAQVSGPEVLFQVSRHTNQPGDTVVMKVTTRGLREVTSAQWTLTWDPAVLRFKTTADYGLKGLAAGNFGTALAGAGKLTFSWDDPDALGVTAEDGTTVFSVSFEVIGHAGTSSPLALADTAAVREVGVKFAPASLRSQDGQVLVVGTVPPTAPAPQLTQAIYSKGTFGVPLATVSGKLYILEYTDMLPSTNWIALPPVAGDGTVKTLSDPAPNTRQRFYRVRIE